MPKYTISNKADEASSEDSVFVGGKTPRIYDISVLRSYIDSANIAAWAKVYFAGVVANGGWSGENGYLTPTAYITRGQFATVMDNLIKNYIDTPGTYTELPSGNTIIRCSNVVLDGVSTDSSLYISDCVLPFGVEFNNAKINRLVVRGCATELGENGEPVNDDYGISPKGSFGSIRIIRPYISADLSGCSYEGLYTAEKTSVILGVIQQ